MAGPFEDDSGALIVMDAPDRAVLDEITSAGPYFTTPGVTVSDVRERRPFLPE